MAVACDRCRLAVERAPNSARHPKNAHDFHPTMEPGTRLARVKGDGER